MAPDHRARSPLRERERATSPQRRKDIDFGHDGEKQVRHIARTRQLTAFAVQEGVPRDWPWVLRCLVCRRSDRGAGCPVHILDTIIYCDGSPESLYHTSYGTVVSSAIGDEEGRITFAKAMAHLRTPKKYASALATSSTDPAAGIGAVTGAVAFTSGGDTVAIKVADVEKIRKAQGTPPAGTEALVLFVPTKEPSTALLLSIQHTFVLEPCSGRPVHRSYRLVMLKGVHTRVPCHSSTLNKKLLHLCKQVLTWIEAYSGARVLRLVLEIFEDIYGDLWLVRSSECSTTKPILLYSQQRRSPSPAQSKHARVQSSKGIADELSLLRYGHAIGESAPSLTSGLNALATHPVPGSRRRAQTAMAPNEASASQGTLNADEWGFSSDLPSRVQLDSRRPQTVSLTGSTSVVMASTSVSGHTRKARLDNDGCNLQDIGVMFQGFAAPGEHDPREIGRTAVAGRALGSSQLGRLCFGDFCNIDLLDKVQQQARFEHEETGSGSLCLAIPPASPSGTIYAGSAAAGGTDSSDETGALRKKILKLDEAALQDHGVLPAEGGVQQTDRNGREKKGRRGREGSAKKSRNRHTVSGDPGSEIRSSEAGPGEAKSTEWSEVPFSWVIRGRQESHLVNQQLRRYRRGNKGPFVGHLSGLAESSVSLGAVFPATYYQSVRVCRNCYRVYSMISKARTKSVRRLDARAAAAAAGAGRLAEGGSKCINEGSTRRSRPQPQPQPRAAKRARGEAGPRRGEQRQPSVHDDTAHEQGDGRRIEVSRPCPGVSNTNGGDPSSLVRGIDILVATGRVGENQDERSMSLSAESFALIRAQAAIDGLTRGDICELRSFAKPPAAVNMAAAALMIALTGQGEPTVAGWLAAKRYMTNIDRLFGAVAELNLDNLRVSQIRKLEAYVRNPAFRPDVIACVSRPASKICAWVLGVLEAHRWRTGSGHPRIDTLGQGSRPVDLEQEAARLASSSSTPVSAFAFLAAKQSRPSNSMVSSSRPWTSGTASSRVTAALGPAVYPFPSCPSKTPANTGSAADRGRQMAGGGRPRPTTDSGFNPRGLPQPEMPAQAWVPAGVGVGFSAAGAKMGSPNRAGTAPTVESGSRRLQEPAAGSTSGSRGGGGGGKEQTTRAGRAAIKRRQARVGERLASATAAPPDPAGFERSDFLCADGVTLMPYAVVGCGASMPSVAAATATQGYASNEEGGQGTRGGQREQDVDEERGTRNAGVLNFVVVHDFFDTLEKTFLLFKPLVLKYPCCQVLCFNSPGQAETRLPPEPDGLLTNVWVAERLDELMQHVDNMGEMPLSDRPFHLLGIGNGASVAAAFACSHASKHKWRPTLRSLVCVNGFATVDAQLAAVLHSAQRAFQCFPPERPDLPISFWSRFIFSEGYLKSVGSDLALNILCAVANPLGAEGMLRIVRGALESRDLTRDLKSIALPLVLIQSTENMLINAANVDPFLEGRRPRHVWSHQLRLRAPATGAAEHDGKAKHGSTPTPSCLGPSGEQALFDSLSSGAEGAFVAWVKGGHETRQECKQLVVDVLELLAAPGGQSAGFFQRGVQTRRPERGRVGMAAKAAAVRIKAETGEATAGPNMPSVVQASGGGRIPFKTIDENVEDRVMPVEDRANATVATIDGDGTAEEGFHRRVGGDRGDGGGGAGDGGPDTQKIGTTGEDGGKDNAAEAGKRSALTYGYASLRKIREREPLPQFPASSGRRREQRRGSRSPRAGSIPLPAGRGSTSDHFHARSLTAPTLTGTKSRNDRDGFSGSRTAGVQDRHGVGLSSSRAAKAQPVPTPEGAGGEKASDWDNAIGESGGDISDGGGGGGVVTLETAIADFDAALRDHRDRRRGVGSTSAGVATLPGGIEIGTQGLTDYALKLAGAGVDFPLDDKAASGWLDGEGLDWDTVNIGTAVNPRNQGPADTQENESQDEAGDSMKRYHAWTTPAASVAQLAWVTPPTPGNANPREGTAQDQGKRDAGGLEGADTAPPPESPQQLRHKTSLAAEEVERLPDHSLAPKSPTIVGHEARHKDAPLASGADPTTRHPGGSKPSGPVVTKRVSIPGEQSRTADAVAAGGTASAAEASGHEGETRSAADPEEFAPNEPDSHPGSTAEHGTTEVKDGAIVCVSTDQGHGAAAAERGRAAEADKEVRKASLFTPLVTAAAAAPGEICDEPERGMGGMSTSGIPRETEAAPLGAAVAPVSAPHVAQAMECLDPVSTVEQRSAGNWMVGKAAAASAPENSSSPDRIPAPLEVAEAEAKLAEEVERLRSKRLAAERKERAALNKERAAKFGQDHAARAEGFAEEDRRALAAEELRLAEIRRKADLARLQRGAEFEEVDEKLRRAISSPSPPPSSSWTTGATSVPVRGMRPQNFVEQEDLPEGIATRVKLPKDKVLDHMEGLEARAKAARDLSGGGGGLNLEEFEKVEQRQRARQVERLEILKGQTEEERAATMLMMAVRLQMFARQKVARMRVARLKEDRSAYQGRVAAAVVLQSLARGYLSRIAAGRLRKQLLDEAVLGGRATTIQKTYRGHLGRLVYNSLLRDAQCRVLQRAVRGFLGRRVATRKRELLARFAARVSAATKLQAAWRGRMARDSYLRVRCSWLASREIQRAYRGHLGRRATGRRREWQAAEPGPERLKLGLRMIEDTKVAFVKQQEEIAALNRAQEKAEARVSAIHHQLTASESELSVLEGEMTQIDHIERELVQLTHERDLIGRGITGAAGISNTGMPRENGDGLGGGSVDDSEDDGGGGGGGGRGRWGGSGNSGYGKEDAYALEMQLQLKRAEREKKRLQLAAEFASTFEDVSDKKRQIGRLSAAVADIEATRLRKSREFGHMQRNLMELLSEQKRELDVVREKGVQLETAAATSAAAAAATAQRAREHEAKAAAMYGQTEELMKFQFMSMSLSYFSSLNMMKQMRDINADTTTAAVAGTADAAAAAAASAAAASIPSLKHRGDLGGDAVSQALALSKARVKTMQSEIEEAESSQRHPFPTELNLWTVDDVCRWLDTLQLGEYKQAFREGKVDGGFLLELRESDLMDSIGMEHKLHLKKLLLARQKLTPLSASEQSMASSVRWEESATAIREEIPDVDTAFSQARHGKRKRLEETLNAGFDINAEDSLGNTLLLAAVQQLQMPVVEFLVQRGANVNHANAAGNTALHFAMSYDTSGKMGEYLINNGADDTAENKEGLSPYDGI